MIRALSLAAALALLPVSAAVAQDQKTQAEVQLEAAASAFEAKMEEFGERAEAIQDIDAVVAEALADVEPMMQGLMTNGAWAQADPDQMVTYGLMADYAVGQTEEALEEVEAAFIAPPAPPPPPAKPARI